MLGTKDVIAKVGGGRMRASLIQNGPLRIVITDSPSNMNMEDHLQQLISFKVKHVVRACEPSYETGALESAGIRVHDLQFQDGQPPTDVVRDMWLNLVEDCFIKKQLEDDEKISVHCIAGLGRAPVLVAIALIEFCHMGPLEAVSFIRKQRRGAINVKQLGYLENYQPTRQKKGACCCIM